jgi:hypothetical protein
MGRLGSLVPDIAMPELDVGSFLETCAVLCCAFGDLRYPPFTTRGVMAISDGDGDVGTAHVCWQVELTKKEGGVPCMHVALSLGFGASRLRDAASALR